MNEFQLKNEDAPVLSDRETDSAVKDLYHNDYVNINRKYCDPINPGEPRLALMSFIKAPGVQCGEDGIFGVIKIRGAFYTVEDADKKAKEIIKNVDSTNSIYTCLIGQPYPLMVRGHALDVVEVDLKEKTEECISTNVKEKRKEEQKEIEEMKRRREELYKDVDPETKIDPEEIYIEHRVKLAQLKWNKSEHKKKIIECDAAIAKCVTYLETENINHPEYETTYLEKYKKARDAVNIPDTSESMSLMKFMMLDINSDDL
jgi:hypothetical protein